MDVCQIYIILAKYCLLLKYFMLPTKFMLDTIAKNKNEKFSTNESVIINN